MSMRRFGSILAAMALIVGFTTGAALAAAQDTATPSAGPEPHPAHIHSGTCEELGDVVYPLNDVSGDIISATPGATPAAPSDAESGSVIAQSQTEIDASLDDLTSDDYAVNVHKSADEIGLFIACGDLSGEVQDGELIIDLQELNDSGVKGQAILADQEDGTTMVTVTLIDATPPEGSVTTPSS